MALINIKTKEYIKLDLNSCYFNINGVYCSCIVFKNKDERDKDKFRYTKINNFRLKLIEFLNSIKSKYNIKDHGYIDRTTFSDEDKMKWDNLTEEEKNNLLLKITDITDLNINEKNECYMLKEGHNLLNQLLNEKYLYYYENIENQDTNINIGNLIYLDKWKELGFEISFKDKICLLRKDTTWLCNYNKQDFTPEAFYTMYKDNCYIEPDGTKLLEDDL